MSSLYEEKEEDALAPLPPPPTLVFPSSTSPSKEEDESTAAISLPPPPPPIDLTSPIMDKEEAFAADKKKPEEVKPRKTTEQIPAFASAPNSGVSLSVPPLLPPPTTTLEEQPILEYVPKVDILAHPRQSCIPIWIVSTEAAEQACERVYNTNLHQLWTHLVQSSSSFASGTFPFRSIQGRHISFTWKQLASRIHFVHANTVVACSDDETNPATQILNLASQEYHADHLSQQLEEEIPKILAEAPHIHIPFSQQPDHSQQQQQQQHNHTNEQTIDEQEDHPYEEPQHPAEKAYQWTSTIDSSNWLARYRMALDLTTQYMPHETIHVPPVIIFVGTSNEGIPALQEMSENPQYFLPTPIQTGEWDYESIQKEFVILLENNTDENDNHETESSLLQKMHSQWNASCCAVLPMSSSAEGGEREIITPLLSSYEHFSQNQTSIEVTIASSDKIAIRRFLTQIVTTSVLPALERRIASLNVAVTNAKKGVKNILKGFWKSNTTSSSSSTSSKQLLYDKKKGYRHDSIESQTRLLADTLFLLMDYESALAIYKLVKDDYKQNHLYAASIHEMMTICYYYMELQYPHQRPYGSSIYVGNIMSNMEIALYAYTRANTPSATRLATRLCLVLASMDLNHNFEMDVADLLASASSHESSLGAAVLLELASHFYYRAKMYRKFAFHMLMAGHMYRTGEHELHATRCFVSSLQYYHFVILNEDNQKDDIIHNYSSSTSSGRWNDLYYHLVSALAGQLYSMGHYTHCTSLYKLLLGTSNAGRVSVKTQQKFITHFRDICCNNSDQVPDFSEETKEICDMNLPTIVDASIQVQIEPCKSRIVKDPSSPNLSGVSSTKENDKHTTSSGNEEIWRELMCCATAEYQAQKGMNGASNETWTSRVIEGMDREKLKEAFRAKKKQSVNAVPTERAKNEPLLVSFVMKNPLGIGVSIRNLQLVAKLSIQQQQSGSSAGNDQEIVCTNLHPLETNKIDHEKVWKFACTDKVYKIADFTTTTKTPTNSSIGNSGNPLFVVTKQDVMLEPSCENQLVQLGITPLAMGDFEILGVRYQIYEDIWVYHPFHVLGQLLQDTQNNRANRVRAESFLLKSKIENDMPSLTVDLIPKDKKCADSVLQGQVSSWVLHISNLGTTSACNITLKTNIPCINILHPNRSNIGINSSTSFCIGPSGTLLQIPLEFYQNKRSSDKDILLPGETIEIPVQVRTFGRGKQELYMLFRYESGRPERSVKEMVKDSDQSTFSNILSDTKATNGSFRWLRKMISLSVSPSLTFTASMVPSYWKKNEHILTIETTNFCGNLDSHESMNLENVFIASRYYKVVQLDGQLGLTRHASDKIHEQSHVTDQSLGIRWQEKVSLHYLVTPVDDPHYTLSECNFSSTKQSNIESTHSEINSVTDFICLEYAHEKFTNTLQEHKKEMALLELEKEKEGQHPRHVAQIRREKNTTLTKGSEENVTNFGENHGDYHEKFHPTSISNLCPPLNAESKINVICSWSSFDRDQRKVHGQHHLRQLTVRPKDKCKGCPLTITASYESSVKHDFSVCPLVLPLEIFIRNRFTESDIEFEFSVACKQYEYELVGVENYRWKLKGGEELTVPLEAIIFTSGIFDLQSLTLNILSKDGKKVPFAFPLLQWNVKVNFD